MSTEEENQLCDSGHSEKKRRYFLEAGDMPPMYAGDTVESLHDYIKAELESLHDCEELELRITVVEMTDEQIEALPDL